MLAGAYRAAMRTTLTHAVGIDAEGNELFVLCERVALDSLADAHACDPKAPPTCPSCAARLAPF